MNGDPGIPARLLYEPLLRAALIEDLGRAGDVTTDAIVPVSRQGKAVVVARAAGRIAGLPIACATFALIDPQVEVELLVDDAREVTAGTELARLQGPARAILTAERTALNLLGRLCGIATATAGIVEAVRDAGATADVVCTRKTTPGLRLLEKYAVRAGGGSNHRFGLDDAVLIKDNHLAIAGGVRQAVARVRDRVGHMIKVEVEVDTISQLEEALSTDIDAVLLDNMDPPRLREAVQLVAGRVTTEASGGIRPETAAAVALTGVDLLSVGWLTQSSPALDVALDVIA